MKQIIAVLALVFFVTACQKEKTNDESNSNDTSFYGRYMGTFSRTGSGDTSSVEIYFKDDNTFEGSSNNRRFPAICSGTFQKSGAILTVNDACAWTADFDWTLIFDGTYSISSTNNSLRIWRTNGTVTDEYLLIRIVR